MVTSVVDTIVVVEFATTELGARSRSNSVSTSEHCGQTTTKWVAMISVAMTLIIVDSARKLTLVTENGVTLDVYIITFLWSWFSALTSGWKVFASWWKNIRFSSFKQAESQTWLRSNWYLAENTFFHTEHRPYQGIVLHRKVHHIEEFISLILKA